MEKKIKYGAILLTVLIISLLIYGYFYHIFSNNPVPAKATRHISAYDLIGLADTNEFLFNRQFLDKILSVGGIVKDIQSDKSGNYTLSIGTNPDISSYVNCFLDSLYTHRNLSLKKGDSCSIRGTCAGRLANIILVQCIIEKE